MMFGQLSNRESLRDLLQLCNPDSDWQMQAQFWQWAHDPIPNDNAFLDVLPKLQSSHEDFHDYRIFEDFAFYMMKEACEKRSTHILDIPGRKYAFDSTTIPLCLAIFPWAKFRKKKGGVKAHVLYDIEAQLPAFYTVTTASREYSQT